MTAQHWTKDALNFSTFGEFAAAVQILSNIKHPPHRTARPLMLTVLKIATWNETT
jgi:hypothetical protein